MTRRLTLVDCIGIGINGIIGSGIFLLPARVFRASGGLAWASWFAVGGVCLLVGLCFCEAAGRAERNGGPYLYARDAFGRWIGVGVGWMALAANLFNQLDTAPGRALKPYLILAPLVRAPLLPAVLIAPYDLREMTMLGDAGSNALGALLGLSSVDRFTGRGRKLAIAALAGLNLLGETRSFGALIERSPFLSKVDRLGRVT